ncbi:MAG: DMT family transporter [Candidatus Micrarchaeota archaeon]|nr:DMT family transporter [Candidatus Micrarchaeota archaeon]
MSGIALAYLAALVSGISVFVNSIGVVSMDPLSYTFLRNLLVAGVLGSIGLMLGKIKEFSLLDARQTLMLLFVGLVGGGIAFALFFSGLSTISGAEGSFLFRLLFIISIVLAVVFFKEQINWKIVTGAAAVIIGNFLILGSSQLSFSVGSLLVLLATILWALEYTASKKLLQTLSPISVASFRMGFGSLFLLGLLVWQGKISAVFEVSSSSLLWIAISTGLLTLFVTLWYSALAKTSLIYATAALTLGGPISALLSFLFVGKALLPLHAFGLLLLAAGVIYAVGVAETISAFSWMKDKALLVLRRR